MVAERAITGHQRLGRREQEADRSLCRRRRVVMKVVDCDAWELGQELARLGRDSCEGHNQSPKRGGGHELLSRRPPSDENLEAGGLVELGPAMQLERTAEQTLQERDLPRVRCPENMNDGRGQRRATRESSFRRN
jgi:hypothetical protein